MRKFIASVVCALALSSVAHADSTLRDGLRLSRTGRGLYATRDGSTAVYAPGCTQTARAMDARIVEHRGDVYVVFLDRDGEEEGDCAVGMVVTRSSDDARVAVASTYRMGR